MLLFVSENNVASYKIILKEAIINTKNYLNISKRKLNVDKPKVMFFNDIWPMISSVSKKVKYLGVITLK